MATLKGKTALVTGGGKGIGRVIAEALAREGATVWVAGRGASDLEATATAIGGHALVMDVGARASVNAGLAALEAAAATIDLLINNAGIAESAPLAETTDELWDRTMAINVTGAFQLCRALVPKMIERGFGRVINVASNAGITGYAYTTAYCASKHAMVGMTRALAVEIARSNVTVNAICPGWVATAMADRAIANIARATGRPSNKAREALAAMSPQKRLIEPEEVAHAVLALCADAARGIHGQAIPIDGGQVMS